jgi:phospholipase C
MALTRRRFLAATAGLAGTLAFPGVRLGRAAEAPIEHVVLVMQENRSFDHYFGLFPGADGFPPCADVQRAPSLTLLDPPHGSDTARAEYANPEAFDLLGGAKSRTYYTGEDIPYYWALAHRFALCDRYFCSVLGPTFPNRLYSVAASSGGYKDNTSTIDPALLPRPNLADRLDEAKVSWGCYFANLPVTYEPSPEASPPSFNPITYYPERRADRRALRTYADFLSDVARGTLPAVSWVVGQDPLSEHPAASIDWGERFVALTVNSIAAGPAWSRTAIVFNYDENGGFYDHLTPPRVDERGLGFRVPCIVASPWVKPGHISSQVYDHTSVIAFVRRLFGLRPVNERDAGARPLEDMFDFGHAQPGFVSYPRGHGLNPSLTPRDWYARLLSLPIPRGSDPVVPAARKLCAPAMNPSAGVVAAAAAGGVTLAAGAASRIRPPSRREVGGGSPGA